MSVATKGAKLVLPMHFRRVSPFGYVHGQINHQGIKHPGYDLNDGPNAWADLGQEMFSPGHSLIKYAGPTAGWGTLLVGYLAEKIEDPVTGELIWAGWRMGHAEKMFVKAGDRVRPGQVVATCGWGKQPGMTPHLHFDLFRRDVLEKIGTDFVARYGAEGGRPSADAVGVLGQRGAWARRVQVALPRPAVLLPRDRPAHPRLIWFAS